MIQFTIRLSDQEAAALAEMARRFQFSDAQHLLRHGRNLTADGHSRRGRAVRRKAATSISASRNGSP
jgi:hypothetical protein